MRLPGLVFRERRGVPGDLGLGDREDEPLIVCVGRIEPLKGIDAL